MLKFKMSLLFNNLKFRIALVVIAITAVVVGIICIPRNKASQINTSLTSNDIIKEATTLIGKGYWVNPNNKDGFEDGWGHGVSNGYLWGGTKGTRKYGKDFTLVAKDKFKALDCTGFIYYTLTNLGCTTTGFSLNNPVPVDPHNWYDNLTGLKLTYKGQTSDVVVYKTGDKVENLPYYMCANGTEIPAGSIVVAAGSKLNSSYHDHGWIYLGNFGTTDVNQVAKILVNDCGVNAQLLIAGDINGQFSIKTYVNSLGKTEPVIQATDANSTHWRIECTAGHGVYINNGDPRQSTTVTNSNTGKVKAIGPIYAFQLANETVKTTGDYTIILEKVSQDGTTVITSSEATFNINGTDKNTSKGVLSIVSGKKIESVDQHDTYIISETKAPDGFSKYDGKISLDVYFKKDGNKYVIDTDKTIAKSEPQIATQLMEISSDCKTIKIRVPNDEQGKYGIVLQKVDKNGKVITTSEATFTINGQDVKTKNGVIVVDTVENCADTNIRTYTIKEKEAPKNYVLFNGELQLSVQMTKTEKGYELLPENVKLVVNGVTNTDKIELVGSQIRIYVQNEKEPFDLALRKFITKINGKDVDVSREPVIDEESINVLQQTGTAAYHHPKNGLLVKEGDEVEYTLRVYNEGKILGYAKQITDYLPEGLSFVKLSDNNSPEYSTSSEVGSKIVVINYSGNKEILTLRDFIGKEVNVSSEYFQEVKLICKVNNAETLNFTNRAEITNYGYSETDSNGNVIWNDAKQIGNSDQDSIQNTIKDQLNLDTWADKAEPYTYTDGAGNIVKINDYYPGAQDDDDFETVYIVSQPQIHKGVKTVENQNSGYSYFDIKSGKTYSEDALSSVLHDWVIESTIVNGINNFKLYEIVDNVDTSKLDFAGLDKVKVLLINKEGNVEKVLTPDVDYKATYKDGKLVVTIISSDPQFKGQFLNSENSLAGFKVRIQFNTTFKVDSNGKLVVLADKIQNAENKATLNYNNGHEKNKIESEIPEVHTGAVSVFKYDDANRNGKYDKGEKALVGAKFKIAYNAEGTNFVKDINGKDIIAVSNEKGIATFTGLAFGGDAINNEANKNNDGTYSYNWETASSVYYIVEVEAPEGYTLLEENVKVTVSKNSSECINLTDKMKSIANVKKYYDLSLRKFITEVNGVKPETSREPQVDISKLANFEATTATYKHPKDIVDVHTSDVVTYTIRVYNEGDYDEFATEIMDDIPNGLVFLPENEINKEYKWIMCKEVSEEEAKNAKDVFIRDGKKYIVTEDAKEADVIVTTYLSKENGDDKLIKAFDGKTLDYKDVKVAFKVVEPTTSDRVLINYAQITKHSDFNGNTTIVDRDSTPNKWIEGEDDQDTEKVKVKYFDLALLKYVSKAIVYENGNKNVIETGHTGYENPEPVVKVDLKNTSLNDVIVKFEYTIKIINEGEIEGYAKEISDYIPEGLKFVAEDNKNWKEVDGKIVTDELANTLLKPGESADVTVILTWINGENNLGLKTNIAEISKDYNEWGTPDIDSTPNNKVPGEDDIDDAPVILAIRTGVNNTYYVIAAVSILIIVSGIVVIKKKVLVK